MTISCENCLCSKCDYWKECNDSIYEAENWCYVCNDTDIDHCFTDKCDKIQTISRYKTHPLQLMERNG